MFVAIAILIAAWSVALWVNYRGVARHDGSGDPRRGIVVFVGPVRWLFIVWGFNAFCRALRGAGLTHAVYLFRWSRPSGSLLVLSDLMRRRRLDAKAARLARLLDRLSREHPETRIHVVAYSTGVYLAFEAVKRIAPQTRLGRVIALHGTVSPAYDLSRAAGRSEGVINVHGGGDCLINGFAPIVFGTNDRVHSAACGMVGLQCSLPNVEHRRWRPGDARFGYLGGHFTVASAAWLRRHIIPRLT